MMAFPAAKQWLAALLLTSAVPPVAALAQDAKASDAKSPAVALAGAGGPWVPARESRVPPLRRTVALRLNNASLRSALDAVARSAGLTVAYGEDVLRSTVRVTLRVDGLPLIDALTTVLDGTGLDAFVSIRGDALLVRSTLAALGLPAGAILGRVTDTKTGAALIGADVFLNDHRWRTTSDTAGRYRLAEIDSGTYTLTVRRLGYVKQSRRVTVRGDGEATVDIALEPAVIRLNELVTTATGRQRRLDVANDVTTINADSVMQTAPIRSVTDLLEGRVPGLTVQRTSGAPGDPARLRLRGASSPLRSNDPIVVVDGVRVYAQQSAARSGNLAGVLDTLTGTSPYATPSPLDYIDPNSIETIEVLKGPSAATLYGQDAANGVIVITSKKGKAGPTRWNAGIELGQTRLGGEFPNLLLRWGHTPQNNIALHCPTTNVAEGVVSGVGDSIGCIADSVVQFQLLNDPALTVLGQGHRSDLSLSASGGTAALTYRVTGHYQQELGLPKLPAYEVERYQARIGTSPPDWMQRPQHLTQWGVVSGITARLGSTADLSLMTNLSRTAQQRSSMEQELDRLLSTYVDKASGTYYTAGGFTADAFTLSNAQTGGFLTSYYQRVTDVATQLTNSLNLDWKLRRWLTLRADAGLNLIQRADEMFLPRGAVDTSGSLAVGKGNSVTSTVNVGGNALVPLGRGFQFRFALGANYAGTSIEDQRIQTSFLPAGTSLQGSKIDGANRSVQDDATFGWYLEPSIGNSRFNFTSGLRLDGGSSYGAGGLPTFTFPPKFPKLGFSYLLSDEPWFPFKNLVQSLRLRVAYGRAGRQPGVTDRLRLYGPTHQIFGDGGFADGVYLQTLGNTQLRPERTTEFEGGFDADLLDSRLLLNVSGYRKTTDDALLPRPVAPSVYGGGSVLANIGRTRNTGLEFTVGAQLISSGTVTWATQLGVSQNRYILVKLGNGVDPFYTEPGNCIDSQCGIRVAPGYPLFGRWSKPILGYADVNENGVLETSEIVVGDTGVYVGQTMPSYTARLSTTVSLWHSLTVNADFDYQDGLSQINEVARRLAPFSRAGNDSTASLAEQAATALVPATDYNWIQTVNTFRFNSMAVRYRVPAVVARRLGAQQLDVAVQGGNLGLWTNYRRGLDPNVNARPTGNGVVDTGVLPQSRTWQVRISATY